MNLFHSEIQMNEHLRNVQRLIFHVCWEPNEIYNYFSGLDLQKGIHLNQGFYI